MDPESLSESMGRLEAYMKRTRATWARMTEEGVDLNAGIRERTVHHWTKGDLEFFLAKTFTGAWGGYVRFPSKPVQAEDYQGILTWVPVHGGIAYAQAGPDGSMWYGFDCGHADDMLHMSASTFERRLEEVKHGAPESRLFDYRPRSLEWLKGQCEMMGACLRCAARVEQAYLEAGDDQEKRARILDQMHNYLEAEGLGEFKITENFGALLAILSGKL